MQLRIVQPLPPHTIVTPESLAEQVGRHLSFSDDAGHSHTATIIAAAPSEDGTELAITLDVPTVVLAAPLPVSQEER